MPRVGDVVYDEDLEPCEYTRCLGCERIYYGVPEWARGVLSLYPGETTEIECPRCGTCPGCEQIEHEHHAIQCDYGLALLESDADIEPRYGSRWCRRCGRGPHHAMVGYVIVEEPETGRDCPACGGSGGGPDAALKCPSCCGSGLRPLDDGSWCE